MQLSRFGVFVFILLQLNGCSDDSATSARNEFNAKLSGSADKLWIAGWQEGSAMSTARAGAAAVGVGNFIYVVGGVDGINFLQTTEYASVNDDGTLGVWKPGPLLNEPRGFIDAVVHGGFVYVVGGGNGANGKNLLRSAERAKILEDGSLGPWEVEQNAMVLPRRCSKLLVIGDHLYSFGGFGGVLLDTVERSAIHADGHLGEWVIEEDKMLLPRYVNTVKKAGGAAYVIGGHDQMKGVGIPDVEWAVPSGAEGRVGSWKATSSLQVGRYGLTSFSDGKRLYAVGGITGLEYLPSIEVSDVLVNGELSPWRLTTSLVEPRATFSALMLKGNAYIIGGTNQAGYLNSVVYAQIDSKGDLGFWGAPVDLKKFEARRQSLLQPQSSLPNEGVVLQVQHASMYTYLRVQGNLGDIWLAGPRTEINPNEHVRFSKGVSMSNFYSKELQQNFTRVLFVSKIEKQTDR